MLSILRYLCFIFRPILNYFFFHLVCHIDEYRALWIIAIIVPCYYIFWIAFGWFTMGVFIKTDDDAHDILEKNDNDAAWLELQ